MFIFILYGENAGQGAVGGVSSSSGATIGAGNGGQSVDPNPFCNSGAITPLCNGGTLVHSNGKLVHSNGKLVHSNGKLVHSNPVGDVCVKYDNDTNTITVCQQAVSRSLAQSGNNKIEKSFSSIN